MPTPPSTYKKLPGQGWTLFHFVRLYQGPDHLLQVRSTGYSETYKRFYYRDIQALVVAPTGMGRVWNALLAAAALCCAMIALSIQGTAAVVFLVLCGLLLLALVTNVLLGRTCSAVLHTPVQVESLPSLSRLRSSQKLLAVLVPLIAAAQGDVAPEILQAEFERLLAPAAPPFATTIPPADSTGAMAAP